MKKYSRSAKIVPICLKRSPVEVLRHGLGLGCVSLPGSAAACHGLAGAHGHTPLFAQLFICCLPKETAWPVPQLRYLRDLASLNK